MPTSRVGGIDIADQAGTVGPQPSIAAGPPDTTEARFAAIRYLFRVHRLTRDWSHGRMGTALHWSPE